MDIQFLDDLHVAVARPLGPFSLPAILQWPLTLRAHPGFRAGMHEIYDLSTFDARGVHFDDVQNVIDQVGPPVEIGIGRVAIVAPGDLVFGLARTYLTLSNSDERPAQRVFRTLDGALEWIVADSRQQDASA
jgi:hypothetical protein